MKHFVVCDLDNCLIRTDLLYEQWLLLAKTKPIKALLSPLWLAKGRAHFKTKLAEEMPLDPSAIPYRTEVMDYLLKQKAGGDSLVLASASPYPWVAAISQHLKIFDDALGTSNENLKGKAKLEAIKRRLGSESFTYLGDHACDVIIWKHAQNIVTVNASSQTLVAVDKLKKPTIHINEAAPSIVRLLARQLRPHQWIKNILVFLPVIAGHKLISSETFLAAILAFVGFSFAASLVYVCNDLLDLHSDRNHYSKKNRPLASGHLPLRYAMMLIPVLFLGALGVGMVLPPSYLHCIGAYLALNLGYTFYFKQTVVIDIILLSTMYTLRIFAGSAATAVPVSEWLLSFSTLFFFSLACVKRYTEIVRSRNKLTLDGRGYRQVDGNMVQTLGTGAGLISVLIILLYLQSNEVRALYIHPERLWLATPILLFWIARIWILSNRDEVHDDPVVFAVKDKVSWICLLLLATMFGMAT